MNDMAKPAGQRSIWRFVALLLACFGVPVLLSLPPLLLLRLHTRQLAETTALLSAQIKPIEQQIAEVKSLDQTRATLLARKQIVEALQVDDMRLGENLRLMGQLPPGLQLLSFTQEGEEVRFTARCDDPRALSASTGLLAEFGWRDVRVVERRWERDRRIERVEITARQRPRPGLAELRESLWPSAGDPPPAARPAGVSR